MKHILRSQSGLTLIELVVYIALAGILLLSITSVGITLLRHRQRITVSRTVEFQAERITQEVIRAVRNATIITTPTAGNSGTVLTLSMQDPALDPTIITYSNGTIMLQVGANPAQIMHSNDVYVANAMFTNLTAVDTPGSVHMDLTLARQSAGTVYTTYETHYDAAATLRQ